MNAKVINKRASIIQLLILISFLQACVNRKDLTGYERFDYFDYFQMKGKNLDFCNGGSSYVLVKRIKDTILILHKGNVRNNVYSEKYTLNNTDWYSTEKYRYEEIGNAKIDGTLTYFNKVRANCDSLVLYEFIKKNQNEEAKLISFKIIKANEDLVCLKFDEDMFMNDTLNEQEIIDHTIHKRMIMKKQVNCVLQKEIRIIDSISGEEKRRKEEMIYNYYGKNKFVSKIIQF